MAESNESPDALADALMELLASDGEPAPQGGEGSPSKEGEQPAEVAQPQGEVATPTPAVDDFDSRYAARRQQEVAEEQRTTRLTELEKLIEEGDDAEVGKLFRQEYSQLKTQSTVSQAATKAYADQVFEKTLDADFITSLSDAEALELHQYVQNLDVPKFISRVVEIKGASASQTDLDALVDAKVQEKLQAAQNAERGKQVRSPSPTSVPAANGDAVPANASNDDLWAAAITELAGV